MNITRFHGVEELKLTVEFLTPTFLGGADQQAELRSAPFKNLLRQWWRLANGDLDGRRLQEAEGALFGTVLGDEEAHSSRIRLSLLPAGGFGTSDTPFNFGQTLHPEVGDRGMNVSNALYLGYGPITYSNQQHANVFRRYITPGSKAVWVVRFPRERKQEIVEAFRLLNGFGTVGSRGRNGFGSLVLTGGGLNGQPAADVAAEDFESLLRDDRTYPHTFGRDLRGLLCWDSQPQQSWNPAMKLLASTYLNTRIGINIAPSGIRERHVLGYPVTHHADASWGGNLGRMPSQLRLMVKRDGGGRTVARILHLPHKLPKPWPQHLPPELDVWRRVHALLDNQSEFRRAR